MKVWQLVKKLNNTELGKGGTHDTYVLIPNNLDISDIIGTINEQCDFVDKSTGQHVKIRKTVGRETRIVGLGQYYRDKDLCAGDEILFERVETNGENKYFVSVQKYTDNLVIQKSKFGFEILVPERSKDFQDKCIEKGANIEIKYLCSEKKRGDSPEPTKFYDVIIDGISILDTCGSKDIRELKLDENKIGISSFYGWKKYIFEVED